MWCGLLRAEKFAFVLRRQIHFDSSHLNRNRLLCARPTHQYAVRTSYRTCPI